MGKRAHTMLAAVLVATAGASAPTVAQPAPGADPMLGNGAGLPVALRDYEVRFTFVGGCSAIFDTATVPSTLTGLAGTRWYGACPFGVAHGPGLVGRDGQYVRWDFVYGKARAEKEVDWFGTMRSLGPPFRSVEIALQPLNLTTEQNLSHGNDGTMVASKREIVGDTIKQTILHVTSIYCPGVPGVLKTTPTKFGPWSFTKEEGNQMKAWCKSRQGLLVFLQSVDTYRWSSTGAQPEKQLVEAEYILKPCFVIGRMQCAQSQEALVAPLRAEVAAMQRDYPANRQAELSDMRARFAPLEAERRRQIAALLRK